MKLDKFGITLAAAGIALLSGSIAAKAQELRFAWWGGDERHKATFELIDAFQKANPGVTIKGEPAGYVGYLERLTTQYAGRSEPDIMQMDWAWLWIFSKKGDGFYDLNQAKSVLKLDAFNKSDLDLMTINGKINALPQGLTTNLFIYNSDTWKKAGVPYPTTWDEMISAGDALRAKLGDKYYPLVASRIDWVYMSHVWATQKFGTTFISAKEPKINYTREQIAEWMSMIKTMVEKKVAVGLPQFVSIAGATEKQPQEISQWVNGEWAGNMTWNSIIPLRASTLPKKLDQIDIGPTVMMPGAKTSGAISRPSFIYSVSKNSKNPEIAAKFLNFMLTTPEGARIIKMSRGVPATTAQFQTLVSEGLVPETMAKAMDQISDMHAKKLIPPASPWLEHSKILDPLMQTVEEVAYGKITPEQAADKLLTVVGDALKRM